MLDERELALIAYGLDIFAEMTGAGEKKRLALEPPPVDRKNPPWSSYEKALAAEWHDKPERVLTCIFSLVHLGDRAAERYA
jgi:hypothetical protein